MMSEVAGLHSCKVQGKCTQGTGEPLWFRCTLIMPEPPTDGKDLVKHLLWYFHTVGYTDVTDVVELEILDVAER